MSRVLSCWIAACLGTLPVTVLAQSMSMQDMPGMSMPTSHDDHGSATPPDDAQHTGHDMAASALPPNDHVPPSPPQTVLHAMSPTQMNAMMQMDDDQSIGMLLVDRLERSRSTSGDMATNWEAEGWYGNAIDRLWLKTEGERGNDGTQDARVEALWSHA